VWVAKRKVLAGKSFTLLGAEGTSELTDWPYVLVMK
jgi:hypothetical protein